MLVIKRNVRRLLIPTLLIALMCAPLVATSLASPEENRAQTQDSSALEDNGQKLIAPAPQGNIEATSEANPVLIQQRDNSTKATDEAASADAKSNDEPNLIANNTAADNIPIIVGATAAALAIVVGAGVAIVRGRKK